MKIRFEDWDHPLQTNSVNFINYYLSNGPLSKVAAGSEEAVRLLEQHIPFTEAVKHRQALGGVFTTHSQLIHMPGMDQGLLERLGFLLQELDLSLLDSLTPNTTWNNKVDAYVNGPDNLRVIIEEIDKAERYIHLSVMLFFNDDSGRAVKDALLNALNRGVKVRIMVDYGVTAVGYEKDLEVGRFNELADELKDAGCRIVDTFHNCYGKEEWPEKRAELAAKGVPESTLAVQDFIQEEYTLDINVINHRKFLVIDGITTIIGSLNIGDQYMYNTPVKSKDEECGNGIPGKEGQWHDGCFRIQGEVAHPLNQLFSLQWTVLGGDVFDPNDSFYYGDEDRNFGEEECTLIASFPGNPVNLIQQYYLSLIKYAGDETIIVNPYLIDQDFWDQLKEITEEEAQHISICNPLNVNDHLTNRAAVRSNMYKPFTKGVSFFDYSNTGRFSHWKIAYDKRSHCVFHGSYNINERSACHDFELGVLIKGEAFAEKMREMIGHDLSVSEEITDKKEFFKHPLLHPSTYINNMTKSFT
ncbi:phospholipase D-like domain-containing protein [Peribacillus sp. SCS-37]|uniref:phospholipase D-like domain-containing protein n=1 Tax=Paraperibacillus esterisolvens TaxID=3115296 RepID=UPI003905D56E